MQTRAILFISIIFLAASIFPFGVTADESELIEVVAGVWKDSTEMDSESLGAFYLYDSPTGDAYQISVHEQSEFSGVIHTSILQEFGKYKKNNYPVLEHAGHDFPISEENRILWISGKHKVVITGPVDAENFSSEIIDYLLNMYPYTNIDTEVDKYLQTVENIAEKSKLPTNFLELDGYSISKISLIQENGNYNQVTYIDAEGNSYYVNMYEAADSTNMDTLFQLFNKGGVETDIFNQSNIFAGEEAYGKFIVWQSAPFIVRVRYPSSVPQELVGAYLDIFPPKTYGFGDLLSQQEKENLLYTSELFENPEDYLNLIFNSRSNRDIPCFSNSPANSPSFIYNRLVATNYPDAEKVALKLSEQCRTKKVVEIPPVALPYDVSDCRIEFGKKLSAAGISFYEKDLLQECLIRVFSKQNFIQNGGASDLFNQLVEEREATVLGLIKARNTPKKICEEDSEGNQVNCYMYNDNIESPPEFVDGEYIPGKLTNSVEQRIVDTTGIKDVEITPVERSIRVTVNGESAIANEPIEIRDGQLYIQNKGIEVYPDEAVSAIGNIPVKKITVQSSATNPVYMIEGSRSANLLFFVPVEFSVDVTVDAVTGEKRENIPWWAFLTN